MKKKGPGLKLEQVSGGDEESSDIANDIQSIQYNMSIKPTDMKDAYEVGSGSAGVVFKSLHVPTKMFMARKALMVEPKEQQTILKEMQLLSKCSSPYIVQCYGAYVQHNEISICMEYMDVGSMERVYRIVGTIPETILGKLAIAILNGLQYLYENHQIIHRDLKPSNILINSRGQVKLCDFGVSGQLRTKKNSLHTFVGTSWYMSPRRITGDSYKAQSDSWSLGLALLEMKIGRFPYFQTKEKPNIPIFDVISHIVNDPAPAPPSDSSPEFQSFIRTCLIKSDDDRPSPSELQKHEFISKSKNLEFDIADWLVKSLGSELEMPATA